MSDELEILDDAALARRWLFEGTPQAIARRLDRITNKKRAGHLKTFKGGGKRLYRLEDVRAYEARAKHSTASMLFEGFTEEDLAELDPAFGTECRWLVGREP